MFMFRHINGLRPEENAPFSKKWGNLQAAYYLWLASYNFCRIHKTLKSEACYGKWGRGPRLGIGRIVDLTRLRVILHYSGRLFLSDC
jgi:hypothetical protein